MTVRDGCCTAPGAILWVVGGGGGAGLPRGADYFGADPARHEQSAGHDATANPMDAFPDHTDEPLCPR